MRTAVERLAPVSRRVSPEPPAIEPLAFPVDALAFVNDPATAEILAALFGATGQGRVQFGGIGAAIQVLQSAPCPQLLVIDISGIADPLGHLDRLADLCPEGTAVVLVGSSQDPQLVDELRAIGVIHYLVKPVDAEHMRAAILDAAGNGGVADADPPAIPPYDPAETPRAGAFHSDYPRADSALPPLEPSAMAAESAAEPDLLDYRPPSAPPPEALLPQAGKAPVFDPFIGPQTPDLPPASPRTAAGAPRATDPFAPPLQAAPSIPPPATTMAGSMTMPFAPADNVDPLPRPVDLLAFLTEAQTASVVGAIIGPHGAAGRIQPGGLNAAIAFLRDNASPKILLIDISGMPEPMSRIDALAEVCAPGTMVIAIGAANDVALYRDLKNAGIYEYLVKPIHPDVLKTIVLEAASGGGAAEPDLSKPVLAVIGTRGGVGASTIAINVAGTLATQGKKTILLDLDLQFGSVALTLDIDPGHGLREALERPDRVDSMFLNSSAVKVADNLYVLAAEEGVHEALTVGSESLNTLIVELQRHFDAIVIDMPRHVAAGNWEALGRARALLLVADLSLVGIRDTTRMLTASKDAVEPSKIKLMISSTGGDRGAKIDRKEFEAALNRKADYVLPEDPKSVSAANRAGRTVVDVAAGSKLAASLRDLCADVIGGPAEAPSKRQRSFSLFRRKKA
jgi:pilus assembly protein CpaE